MGRRRKTGKHLPSRLYERRGKFYYVEPGTERWIPLGDEVGSAMAAYGKVIGVRFAGNTLHDLFARYKLEITPLPLNGRARPKDAIANEIRTINRFDRVFGEMMQDSLVAQDLYKYIDDRIDERDEFVGAKKPAPSAARHDVRFLKKVLARGIRWGMGVTNAALNLQLDPDPNVKREVTPEEYQSVYALASERMQIAMDLATNIGQRRGDILAIEVAHITATGILIRQGKTGSFLEVELTPSLNATIDRAKALKPDIPKDFLLRNENGDPYTSRGFGSIWQKLIRKALKKEVIARRFKFHDLRKKAATDKAKLTSLQDAADLLGHSSTKTTSKNYITSADPKKVKPVR